MASNSSSSSSSSSTRLHTRTNSQWRLDEPPPVFEEETSKAEDQAGQARHHADLAQDLAAKAEKHMQDQEAALERAKTAHAVASADLEKERVRLEAQQNAVLSQQQHAMREFRGRHVKGGIAAVGRSATVLPLANYSAHIMEQDAHGLRKAMSSFSTNEQLIVHILGSRSCEQRRKLADQYKQCFSRSLEKDLSMELAGNFRAVVLAMLKPVIALEVEACRAAISGPQGQLDASCLLEIVCSKTSAEIHLLRDTYGRTVERDLVQDIAQALGHDAAASFVTQLLQTQRTPESIPVQAEQVTSDAQSLYDAYEGKIIALGSPNLEAFLAVFPTRSYAHLRAVLQAYHNLAATSLESSLQRLLSDPRFKVLLEAFQIVIATVQNSARFWATRLNSSLTGLGTDDEALIRQMVTRCEVDLEEIKRELHSMDCNLKDVLQAKTLGSYSKCLQKIARLM